MPSCLSALTMKVRSKGSLALRSAVKREQLLALHEVDLVQDQVARRPLLLQPLDDRLRLLPDAAFGIDDQGHDVGVLGALPGGGDHGALEPALGDAEDARRVDQHDLRAAAILRKIGHGDADHAHARGLHLGRHDRDLRADQRVDQRRLAGVGRADDGGEACACAFGVGHVLLNCSSIRVAAALSASRLVSPRPCAGGRLPTLTSTRNTGSCSVPSRPICL